MIYFNGSAYSQVDLYLDNINVYVSSYGKIGIYSLPDTIGQIVRISPLVATGLGEVNDSREDGDIEEETILVDNPLLSDHEIYGSYNNNYSGLPPNVLVKQNIYCWNSLNAVVIKYTVINREVNPIDAVFGLELIPEVEGDYSGGDTVTYNSTTKILSDRKNEAVGFGLLSGELNSLNMFIWYSDYNNDTSYWDWMTNGVIDTFFVIDPTDPLVDDPVMIPSFSSQTLAVGDSAVYFVSAGYGANQAEMLASMAQAEDKYTTLFAATSVNESEILPSAYSLSQNYPNPFNPSTKISFQIPQSENVTLKIYNVLGKEVATLINGKMAAGKHDVDFSAEGLSSGLYFYSLKAGSFQETKKMILIK